MITRVSLWLLLVIAAFTVIVPLEVMADTNHRCEMHFVYRSSGQNINELVLQSYQEDEWSEPVLVHSNASGFSYAATMVSDAGGNSLFVWVEDSGASNQLMYRVKSRSGDWLGKPQQLTSAKGEKTTPILIRSISGIIYLSWVSDQNGSDDVFISNWSLDDGWSEAKLLSFDNAFPDIRPGFEYVEDVNGAYELLVLWQARSNDGIYVSDQHSLEADLEFDSVRGGTSERCSKELSKVALPIRAEEGFLHFPQIGLESYQRITLR